MAEHPYLITRLFGIKVVPLPQEQPAMTLLTTYSLRALLISRTPKAKE